MERLIEATDIQKSYGTLQVLKGISMQVQKGEVLAITGPSGAGKSTLLHILSTLDKSDKGSVLFGNEDVNKMSEQEKARFRNHQIGFIFQFHNLLPEFTAIENVCIPAFIQGMPRAEAEQRATELLQRLGLAHRLQHKPSELSGGEQQRVAVARALINKPEVIFADEPSGNLDSKNAEELHQLFFDLRKELNQTFVIVTHNENLAQLADRRIILKDGLILV
jgi:lipoprotein-releasing system ATP-binding protein